MNNQGFSLIELLIAIALIGILSGLATFGFSQYTKKSGMVNQTRLLYGDLMEYRVKSIYEKKNWTFKMSAAGYGIYSSVDTTVSPFKSVVFKHPVEQGVTTIKFDSRGMTNNQGSVCIAGTNDAAVDAVVISTTRVQLGKKMEGEDCVAEKINAR